ncbi:MAG: hypothetical protein IAE67_10095 [Candidatus Competibacteraceae bacterium]|nr:hypothetical protein [Candidatus Competibacteraceae bacterium]
MKKSLLPFAVIIALYSIVYLMQPSINDEYKKSKIIKTEKVIKHKKGISPPLKHSTRKQKSTSQNVTVRNIITKQKKRNKISPPILIKDIEYSSYSMVVENGAKLIHEESHTLIEIPPSIFCDANGEIVQGKVAIQYRELHHPSRIFLAGIPMKWDDSSYLESGGMLEIRAYQNGEPVYIRNGKSIHITMKTEFTDTNYQLYQFNEFKGDWNMINQDYTEILITEEESTTNDETNIRNENTKENKDVSYTFNKSKYVDLKNQIGFMIEQTEYFDKKENCIIRFPILKIQTEMKIFNDVAYWGIHQWQITSHTYSELLKMRLAGSMFVSNITQDRYFRNDVLHNDPINGTLIYDDMQIIYPGNKGIVDLIFTGDFRNDTLGVIPRIKQKRKQKKFIKDYQKLYAAMYDSCKYKRDHFLTSYIVKESDIVQNDKDLLNEYIAKSKISQSMERKFQVSSLGYWNIDRPFPVKPNTVIYATFRDKNDNRFINLYIKPSNKNTVIQLNHFDWSNFPVLDHGNMWIWAIKDADTIVYLSPEDVKSNKIRPMKKVQFILNEIPISDFMSMIDKDVMPNESVPML